MDPKKGWLQGIFKFFTSMKVGLVLLGVVAVLAGFGSLIPVYGTLYFRILLGLLSINLVSCSLHRFRALYHKTFTPLPPHNQDAIPENPRAEQICSTTDFNLFLQNTVKKAGYYVVLESRESTCHFIALKRRFGHWGSFLTHLSFVILLFGALTSSLTSYKGFILAPVGALNSLQMIQAQKGSLSDDFSFRVNAFKPVFLPNGERENWYTQLSFLNSHSQEVEQATLSVNHPFTYQGISFYQSAWALKVSLQMGHDMYPNILYEGYSTGLNQIPGTDMSINIDVGKNLREPVITYQVMQGTKLLQQGEMKEGQTADLQGKCSITLNGWVAGLQVKKDPGVPLIWIGCGLIMIGILMAFYYKPKTLAGIFNETSTGSGILTVGLSGNTGDHREQLNELSQLLKLGFGTGGKQDDPTT